MKTYNAEEMFGFINSELDSFKRSIKRSAKNLKEWPSSKKYYQQLIKEDVIIMKYLRYEIFDGMFYPETNWDDMKKEMECE